MNSLKQRRPLRWDELELYLNLNPDRIEDLFRRNGVCPPCAAEDFDLVAFRVLFVLAGMELWLGLNIPSPLAGRYEARTKPRVIQIVKNGQVIDQEAM